MKKSKQNVKSVIISFVFCTIFMLSLRIMFVNLGHPNTNNEDSSGGSHFVNNNLPGCELFPNHFRKCRLIRRYYYFVYIVILLVFLQPVINDISNSIYKLIK